MPSPVEDAPPAKPEESKDGDVQIETEQRKSPPEIVTERAQQKQPKFEEKALSEAPNDFVQEEDDEEEDFDPSQEPSKVPSSASDSAVAAMNGMSSLGRLFKNSVVKYEAFVLAKGRRPNRQSNNHAERKLAEWKISSKRFAEKFENGEKVTRWNAEKDRLLKMLEVLDRTPYPPLEKRLFFPKGVELDDKMIRVFYCRVSSCNKQPKSGCNHFCNRFYSTYHPDREANMKKGAVHYPPPPLSENVIVTEGVCSTKLKYH